MIQINPDKIRVIELTPKEQKAILKHCHSIDRDMYMVFDPYEEIEKESFGEGECNICRFRN